LGDRDDYKSQKTHRTPDPIGIHVDMNSMKLNTLWQELIENHAKAKFQYV